MAAHIRTPHLEIELAEGDRWLWRLRTPATGRTHPVLAPTFEVEGAARECVLRGIEPAGSPVELHNGVFEHRFLGAVAGEDGLRLEMVFRVAADSPVLRFRYLLHSRRGRRLTRSAGRDNLTYLGLSLAEVPRALEVRLSEFLETVHSYCPVEREVEHRHFENRLRLIGPLLVADGAGHALLAAYEHGATAPDTFLEFALAPERAVTLRAAKGNYLTGQRIGPGQPYQTLWLHLAAMPGDRRALARAYRAFALHHLSPYPEPRRPYLFYNTWNYQERNHHWHGRPYLESMNQQRMLEEIEVAHRLGIEVFVIDTGWYEKTGDWQVSRHRFPDGLGPISDRLERLGMRLGLWFNPTAAAASSRLLRDHEDCVVSWRGRRSEPHPIWETEESYRMCLVSRYADAFADKLIALHRDLGVSYFKWDAVDQYGCDDPGHHHGDSSHTLEERADSFAFQLGPAMVHIAERLQDACPGAIVDFDVTEAGRFVGLGFLAASKYFLVNNGPYYQSYNLPLPPDGNWNMFFYPGPARAWICRTPLAFDRWLPSVLFMTHYLPDDPESSQLINLASLMLGQSGLWGDLPALSPEGAARIAHLLGLYKQVRDDVTEAYPVRSGPIAGSPEVYEKIWERSGRGLVAVFATRAGRYAYVTENRVADGCWATPGVAIARDERGRARLDIELAEPSAALAFFGVTP